MKYANAVALSSVLVCLVGCASAPKVVVQQPVGPCHRVAAKGAGDGSLQVYSARERSLIDVNTEEFFWDNTLDKNDYLYGSAHTDYTILGQDGTVFQHVRNARGRNYETPTLVRLPPGSYTVEAEAEDSGAITMTVVIPLVVEAGQTTVVHLEPNREPSGETLDPSRLVRLADGRIIGCNAQHLLSQK
jgi:hypothetical protein